MVDAHISLLYKAAATLTKAETNQTQSILRSHYLMRCMQITKGYGLPDKHFSTKTRCPHCCIEWNKSSETKFKPLKLSKRQRRRIKSQKPTNGSNRKALLHSNELEQICSFCKHSTLTPIPKPKKEAVTEKQETKEVVVAEPQIKKCKMNIKPNPTEKKAQTSIYYNAKEVFSLKNKNNALASTPEKKAIKNNKRKKDKFAGLCQQAVLTAAKLKEAKNKNKLLGFLKTST